MLVCLFTTLVQTEANIHGPSTEDEFCQTSSLHANSRLRCVFFYVKCRKIQCIQVPDKVNVVRDTNHYQLIAIKNLNN